MVVDTRNKTILAIGAHPDDIEIGCGATLTRHVDEGANVIAVIMTEGDKGKTKEYNRIQETSRALEHLGVDQIVYFDYPDTRLEFFTDELITSLESVIKMVPDNAPLIRTYTMCCRDRHQDHRAVYNASIVACRAVKQILTYETPSGWFSFRPDIFSDISEFHLEKKLRALQEHHSQQHRNYMNPEQIRSVARFRGQQSGCELGEAFTVYRMVI